MNQGDEPVDGQHDQPIGRNVGALARPRAIRDHLAPLLDDLNPGIVSSEIQVAHFELKHHIRAFLEVCDSFRQQGVHEDVLKLKLFPYSLRDRARAWLSGVPAGSLESWADICRSFLMRYNPPNMHTQLRNDIASFKQADDKMMLDASANGTLLDKSPEEAFEILDRTANNDYQFPTSRLGSGRRTSGKLELDAKDSVSAQLSTITNLLKNLQKPSDVREAKALSCFHCEGNHHATDCPVMYEQASYLGNFNRNSNNPYSNTYNPVGQIAQAFHVRPHGNLPSNTEVTKRNEKEQCSALTLRSGKEINKEDKFGGKSMEDPTPSDVQKEHEFVIDSPIEEDKGEKLDNEKTEEKHINVAASATPKPVRDEVHPPPPFPQRLKKHKEDLQFQKFVNLVSSVNLMPKAVFKKIGIWIERPTTIILQLADRSHVRPEGKVEDVIVKIKEFERLKKEDVEEPKATPCESNRVSSFIIRPGMRFKALDFSDFTSPKPSLEHAPSLELKPLPPHLKYVYLGSNETLPVIISSKLLPEQECSLIFLLSQYKKAIGWTMVDLKGISPTICMHKIILEECHSNSVEPQRRLLNPTMKKVVMKEIIKWLDAGVIYPISDSSWVSHVQCVPKKEGITIVTNDENEILPT
ncbi:hypothetical protein GQ457_02G021700 [Hibiscus cannabinus]